MRFLGATVLLLAALAAATPLNELARKKTTTTTSTTSTTSTTEEPVVTELPPFRGDYELMSNFGYYKVYNKHSSWRFAWEQCFNDGAHLLILRSQEEYNALQKWKPGYQVPGYSWYGAHHRYMNQNFVTLFDEPLSEVGYYKWSRDFTSNRTLYNNVDYPEMIVNLHPAQSISEGLLLVYKQSSYFYVCKMDI